MSTVASFRRRESVNSVELATQGFDPSFPTSRVRLRGWLAQMTLDTTVAVVGTLLITLAFPGCPASSELSCGLHGPEIGPIV